MTAPRWPVAAGLAAGYAADVLAGDPARLHPVAGFGRLAQRAEERRYAPTRRAGALHALRLVGGAAAAAWTADRLTARRPRLRLALTALVVWASLGGRSLARQARSVRDALDRGDLDAARRRIPALVGRDPSTLDAGGLARATVESVAENTADAVVGPLLWGGLAGPAGVAMQRAANTLDAMVGYRDGRYRRFGWAAARLDDAVNRPAARLTAALAALLAPVVGGVPATAAAVVQRDAAGHPSRNAGAVEAAFAGALGVRLGGGDNRYGEVTEHRPALGDGRAPRPDDIGRALALARAVGRAALVAGVLLALVRGGR